MIMDVNENIPFSAFCGNDINVGDDKVPDTLLVNLPKPRFWKKHYLFMINCRKKKIIFQKIFK